MMDLSAEQRSMVESVRDIAAGEFVDEAYAAASEVPWENLQALADRGFLGVNFDEAYGGGGLSEEDAVVLTEAVGRLSPDTGAVLAEQQLVGPRAIHAFGREAAKERYLPAVAAGESGIAVAISEPQAGSDVQAMETTVTETADGLVMNGEKIWVSRVTEYDAAVVWTRFADEGIGSVVIDLDATGVEMAEHFTNMAGHEQSQLYFEDVHIPPEHVLLRGEDAFARQLGALNWERLAVAATMTGTMMAAVDAALDYAGDRTQFDQPIADFQGMEWKFAEMVTDLQAARGLLYGSIPDAGADPDPLNTNIAKLYASRMAESVVSEALQVHGANGYQQGHLLEYLYRSVRGYRLAGGTDEIHKNTIARLLKRQGLPAF